MTSMHEHLKSRWLDLSLYSNIYVDDEIVAFPMYNLSGKCYGYQCYNPTQPKKEVGDYKKQKYFSWTTKPCASRDSELVVWGLETVNWLDPFFFITEGIFDACRLHWHGLPAVAMMGCNPVHLGGWLMAMPQHKIACVQGDKPGKNLAKFGDSVLNLPEAHDVGSLPEDEFLRIFARWIK